jgi:2,4-dienoyl-CoA reductase-like NADH-dependent reductase (Old Yellow Enzyme family)
VHAGNGYLLDQFLQKASNHRTDKYGGTHENQARLLMEVIEAIGTVYPMNRIGVRLSPNGAFGGMGHAENKELFPYVAKSLNKYGLGYLHVMDGLAFGFHKMCEPVTMADIRKVYDHPTMSNCGLTRDVAEGMIRSGTTDLACFGRLYVSNPDLVERYANDWPIAAPAPYESWWTVDGTYVHHHCNHHKHYHNYYHHQRINTNTTHSWRQGLHRLACLHSGGGEVDRLSFGKAVSHIYV